MKKRCEWAAKAQDMHEYHDEEWGVPVNSDDALFERLCLEMFQSGLSWRTILAKRENFRKSFRGFDVDKVARFGHSAIERLLQDPGIVRHRGKIEAAVNNAKRAKVIVAECGGLENYFLSCYSTVLEFCDSESELREKLPKYISSDLKKKGWKFFGPTTVYSFLQANGFVNDHDKSCFRFSPNEKLRLSYLKDNGI